MLELAQLFKFSLGAHLLKNSMVIRSIPGFQCFYSSESPKTGAQKFFVGYPVTKCFQIESALSLNLVPVHLCGDPSSLGPPNIIILPDRSHMDFRTNPIESGPTPADPVICRDVHGMR